MEIFQITITLFIRRLMGNLFLVVILTLFGCKPKDKQSSEIVWIGHSGVNLDENATPIKVDDHTTFNSLLNTIDSLACENRLPVLETEFRSILYKYRISTPCWGNSGAPLIRNKNVLIAHNDSIEKRLTTPWKRVVFSRSHLGELLEKDISNNGKDPNWSIKPSKHILFVSVSDHKLEKLHLIFQELSETYQDGRLNTDIRIWLMDYVPYAIPPPPPPRQ